MQNTITVIGLAIAVIGIAAGIITKKGGTVPARMDARVDPVTSVLHETDWDDYIWPTDASRWMTSNFAEFRDNHFHAGIDVSTNMKEGYNVFAVRDGWLNRITFEPRGYGWLLVLRHADGFHSAYAHLRGFPPRILAAYRKKQIALGRSFGSVEFDDREVPVKKGEVVAFTGATGAGPPHLHFEIRDRRYNPVNPCLARQIRIKDSIPPVILSILYQPLDALSTVNGKNERLFVTPRQSQFAVEPVLTGRVGILVRAHDLANEAKSGFTPYKLELFVDGKKSFDVTFNRIQDSLFWHIRIDRDHELMRSMKGEYRKLYREEGNLLSVYTPDMPDAGVLCADSLGAGKRTITIVATDISGNSTRVTGSVTVALSPRFTAAADASSDLHVRLENPASCAAVSVESRASSGAWTRLARLNGGSLFADNLLKIDGASNALLRVTAIDKAGISSQPQFVARAGAFSESGIRLERTLRYDEIVYRITTSSIFTMEPKVRAEQNGRNEAARVVAVSPSEYRAVVKSWPGFAGRARILVEANVGGKSVTATDELTGYHISAGEGGELRSEDGKFLMRFRPGDVTRSLLCTVQKTATDSSSGYAVSPGDIPLAGSPTVEFALPAGAGGMSHPYIQARHPGIAMRHSIAQVSGGGATVSARFGYFLAQYFLFNDQSPPSIQIGFGGRKSFACSIALADAGSGINTGTLKIYVDDKLVNAEYSERRGCFIVPPEVFPKHARQVTVSVADRAGNVATAVKSLR